MSETREDTYTIEHTCGHEYMHHLWGGCDYNKDIVKIWQNNVCPTCANESLVELKGEPDYVESSTRSRASLIKRFNAIKTSTLSADATANYTILKIILHTCSNAYLYTSRYPLVNQNIADLLHDREAFDEVVTASYLPWPPMPAETINSFHGAGYNIDRHIYSNWSDEQKRLALQYVGGVNYPEPGFLKQHKVKP